MTEPRPEAPQIVRFGPATEAVLAEMEAALGLSSVEVVGCALSMWWWLFRQYRQGSRILVQRGDVVTELDIPALDAIRRPPTEERASHDG